MRMQFYAIEIVRLVLEFAGVDMVLTLLGIDKVSTTGYMSANMMMWEVARHDSHAVCVYNTRQQNNAYSATADLIIKIEHHKIWK